MTRRKQRRQRPAKRTLAVEGGGYHRPDQRSSAREAFRALLTAAGVEHKPRVTAYGSRRQAYEKFTEAQGRGEAAYLLVDAEAPIHGDPSTDECDPWDHVATRPGDGWPRPNGARDEQLHYMTIAMEAWLLSDHDAIVAVFGDGVDRSKLLAEGATLERQGKDRMNKSLAAATQQTTAGAYGKGRHSWSILARVRPSKLEQLPWAKRFLDQMRAL